jgi:D-alanyl-D-alanine carboxypeptidase
VATVVLGLVEEGRLGLDDPLDRVLPDFPQAHRITIRDLLSHTSGIPDYTQAHGYNRRLADDREHRWSTAELLGLVADRDPLFAPGTDYDYSNTNYLLLGEVIETVTGEPWSAEIRRRIIDPLELEHTTIAGAEPMPAELVSGYFDLDNDGDTENVDAAHWPAQDTAEGPAGAIVSTAPDLARFAKALFGGELLGPESLTAMVTPNAYGAPHHDYGLGVEVLHPDYETEVWGHGGVVLGFRAQMMYLPGSRTVIVVLVNETTADPLDLGELAMHAVERGVDR